MLSIVSFRDESIPAAFAFSLWQPTQYRVNKSWTAVAVSSLDGWLAAGTAAGFWAAGAGAVAGVAFRAAARPGPGAGACADETTTQLSPMIAARISLFIPPKRIPQLPPGLRFGFPAVLLFISFCRYLR